jgi:hypothetical protein
MVALVLALLMPTLLVLVFMLLLILLFIAAVSGASFFFFLLLTRFFLVRRTCAMQTSSSSSAPFSAEHLSKLVSRSECGWGELLERGAGEDGRGEDGRGEEGRDLVERMETEDVEGMATGEETGSIDSDSCLCRAGEEGVAPETRMPDGTCCNRCCCVRYRCLTVAFLRSSRRCIVASFFSKPCINF